ncbi:recombination protein RecT [Inquilinus ginsengisoli]|uniref:Recombination protein RecT n=1 Tax=Inquilinus ginsengisoli TaxID=363840 RepID=A0ABU1JJ31_9PROT|nr:recombinase RecT [Inquilinus ginsengisoli]MDR6288625.1 recombination protein RecT [Inquilinus ginsengisoli]
MCTIEAERPLDIAKKQIAAMEPALCDALPAYIPVGKFIRTVQTVVTQNPKLLDCDRTSLFAACEEAARLGLMTDGILGESCLVPRPDGTVGLRIMYKGLLKLARHPGELSTIFADIVYSNDSFTADPLHHEEAEGDRGHPVAYYARAKWRESGEWETVVMTHQDVERICDSTDGWKAFKTGKIKDTPWETHFDAMALKAVLIKLCKTLPQTVALRRALEIEAAGGRAA